MNTDTELKVTGRRQVQSAGREAPIYSPGSQRGLEGETTKLTTVSAAPSSGRPGCSVHLFFFFLFLLYQDKDIKCTENKMEEVGRYKYGAS